MRPSHYFFPLLFILFLALHFSCKNRENKNADTSEMALQYQCPMDCEDGKTYSQNHGCPVCKMALAATTTKGTEPHNTHNGDKYKCGEGKCKCEEGKCKCADCPEHGKDKASTAQMEGNCDCGKDCACKECPKHSKKTNCCLHRDGKCKCEEGKCKCADCPMHGKAKAGGDNTDGNCDCGKDCTCENCPEHGKKANSAAHKEGNCSCEEGNCKCDDCPVHT